MQRSPVSTGMGNTSMPIPRLQILLKAAKGHHVVDVRAILHAEADARFCRVFFTDGTDKAVFHTLTELEEVLCCGERIGDLLFLRVHKSHLVAFHHAVAVGTDRRIVLNGGHSLSIGRQYWASLLTLGMSVRSAGTVVRDGSMPFNRNSAGRPQRT